jgi:hypothetical protein
MRCGTYGGGTVQHWCVYHIELARPEVVRTICLTAGSVMVRGRRPLHPPSFLESTQQQALNLVRQVSGLPVAFHCRL